MPDAPLVAAGAFGGPTVIYMTTPLRNALTLGAQDVSSGSVELYRRVFARGFLRGWAGGHYFAAAACPGFIMLGPAYHFYNELLGGMAPLAVGLTAISESLILYGSETKNAQVSYNQDAKRRGAPQLKPTPGSTRPVGACFHIHVLRNYFAMSGLRILSPPCQEKLTQIAPSMSPGTTILAADIAANCVVQAFCTPVHQVYQFLATTRQADHELLKKPISVSVQDFLKRQYLTEKGSLSRIALRDVSLRVAYSGTLYTLYGILERSFVASFPDKWRRDSA